MAEFNPGNTQHLVTLQGRKYITFVGLQARLADQGKAIIGTQIEVDTRPTKDNNNRAEVRVTLKVLKREQGKEDIVAEIQCVGDADNVNVSKNLQGATLRMAETRALSRALRIATRAEYTARDELPPMGDED